MLARVGEETYAIPTAAIEQIIAIDTLDADARFSAGGREMLSIDGRAIGLIALADVLDRPAGGIAHYAIVLSSGERRMAFLVDDLITEQEMVIKPLNPELTYIRHVAGATLLGSGEVVIILNVADLVKTAQSPATTRQQGRSQPVAPPPQTRTILVVDDSITTRTLEKNILEAAGFDVVTATNGLEALDVLERARCSLVVADIEMPYMDGFELTARIRHNERFGHLPVILVTSLELPEYREQGFQVGADAYMVKGSFNQGELLYTVRQLIG
jgi:two-component system chemotaxis sensor kinase CheA